MDGFKDRVRRSLQWRLFAGISIMLLAFSLAFGVWSFTSAFQEAHEFQDDLLRQIAFIAQRGNSAESVQADAAALPESNRDMRVVVWSLPLDMDASSTRSSIPLPMGLRDGLQTVQIDGSSWRLFVHSLHDQRRIVVGQRTAVRNENAVDSGTWTVVPLLLLWPILCGLVGLLVRRTLRPVNALAQSIDRLTDRDLAPVPAAKVPVELLPFVQAINRLLRRLSDAAGIQRRFVADAAHELRSPLTALSVQIENAAGAMRTEPVAERLAPARQGIARLRALLEQLLALTRVQSDTPASRNLVPLQPVLRRVLQDLLPEADRKNIEIEVDCPDSAAAAAQEIELVLLLRNVLDNAIRYSTSGGKVEVSIESKGRRTTIDVCDNGPGIPLRERGRVFDPFYRGGTTVEVGSGLGLSIVRAIVDRLDGTVILRWTDSVHEKGLHVWIALGIDTTPASPR
ncbi:MAG: two-component sensor histidine kinase [Proteobacteria bacterium]|nr:two-component sensor histidine kinase [Pseudomonadota bacterium]